MTATASSLIEKVAPSANCAVPLDDEFLSHLSEHGLTLNENGFVR